MTDTLEKLRKLSEEFYVEIYIGDGETHIWIFTNDNRFDPEFDRIGDTFEQAVELTYDRWMEERADEASDP